MQTNEALNASWSPLQANEWKPRKCQQSTSDEMADVFTCFGSAVWPLFCPECFNLQNELSIDHSFRTAPHTSGTGQLALEAPKRTRSRLPPQLNMHGVHSSHQRASGGLGLWAGSAGTGLRLKHLRFWALAWRA